MVRQRRTKNEIRQAERFKNAIEAHEKVLDNSTSSSHEIALAEKRLKKVLQEKEQFEETIKARQDASQGGKHPTEPETAAPALPDLTKMSDSDLRELFALERFLRSRFEPSFFYLTPEDIQKGYYGSDPGIAGIVAEIVRRKLSLVWTVEGTDLYVNKKGNVIEKQVAANAVYIGTVSLPEEHPIWKTPEGRRALNMRSQKTSQNEERPKPTLTSLQKAYWNRGKKDILPPAPVAPVVRNLDFAYRLSDGTIFWNWNEVQPTDTPLPRSTKILAAPTPPGYVHGSHVIPAGLVFDEIHLSWRRP